MPTSHSRRVFFECPKKAIRNAVVPGSYCERCGFHHSFQWILIHIKVLTAIAIGHLFGILPVASGSWSFRLKSFKFYYALLAILSIFFLMLISLYEQSINKITSSKICEDSWLISSHFEVPLHSLFVLLHLQLRYLCELHFHGTEMEKLHEQLEKAWLNIPISFHSWRWAEKIKSNYYCMVLRVVIGSGFQLHDLSVARFINELDVLRSLPKLFAGRVFLL